MDQTFGEGNGREDHKIDDEQDTNMGGQTPPEYRQMAQSYLWESARRDGRNLVGDQRRIADRESRTQGRLIPTTATR